MNWLVSMLGQRGILIPEYGAWDAREDPRLHGGAERFAYKGTRRRLGYFPTSNLLILPMEAQLNG